MPAAGSAKSLSWGLAGADDRRRSARGAGLAGVVGARFGLAVVEF